MDRLALLVLMLLATLATVGEAAPWSPPASNSTATPAGALSVVPAGGGIPTDGGLPGPTIVFDGWIREYPISGQVSNEPPVELLPLVPPAVSVPGEPQFNSYGYQITEPSNLSNYYDPFSRQLPYGVGRPQPYRFGWYSYDELNYAPPAAVSGDRGNFSSFDWNGSIRFSRPFLGQYIAAWTPVWNTRWWNGPHGESFPAHVDQFESDFQLSSARSSPWNWQLGFTPQVNSDFYRSPNSSAYIFDFRGVLFYQPSPNLRLAMGVAVWDRLREDVIPYGGVLWTPNDTWEFRLFFPKSRISRYWGTISGNHVWTYLSAEYDSQAYQVDEVYAQRRVKERLQMTDDQLLAGVSAQHNNWTAFTEAGAIVGRWARFSGPSPNFNIQDGFLARLGVLY
jgi:hypothetical protein